jgi:hypothetical protein
MLSVLKWDIMHNYLHLTEGPQSDLMHVRVPHDDVSNRPDAEFDNLSMHLIRNNWDHVLAYILLEPSQGR